MKQYTNVHGHKKMVALVLAISLCLACNSSVYAAAATQYEKAADFELADSTGALHKLSDYRGKVVLLNFWATWCKECVEEIPSLNSAIEKYKDQGLVVLGISIDREWKPIEKLLKTTPMQYPVLLDHTGAVFVGSYTIVRLPSSILINRDGFIIRKIPGSQDFDSRVIQNMITDLLKEK